MEQDQESCNPGNKQPRIETKPLTNEEITAAIMKIEENLAKITKMIADDKKSKSDSDDAKVNELAKLRDRLNDFRLYT